MNYQSLRQLLTDMGIWSPLRPGPRNKTLRWEDEQGKRIPGVYLNETDTDMAYLTLNSASVLNEDEDLWANLPLTMVAEVDKANRNIYPLPGKELEALHQLFDQRENKLQAEEQARIDEIRMDSRARCPRTHGARR